MHSIFLVRDAVIYLPRLVPLFFRTVLPQLIPNFDVPYFSPIFLLTTHQSAVPYHEHILLSLMCQRGLGPIPSFFQKICLASLTYCPLLNIMSVKDVPASAHLTLMNRTIGLSCYLYLQYTQYGL